VGGVGGFGVVTVLVRLGAVESRRFGFELVKPLSVVVSGGSASATVSALGSVEFTSCETLSLNGVFQSGYDNYMVSVRHSSSGSAIVVRMRLRAAGVDESAGNYTRQFITAFGTSVAAARGSSATEATLGTTSSTLRSGDTVFIYGPHLAQPTAHRNVSASSAGSLEIYDVAGTHSLSTAYDGMTIYLASGSLSGRVAVYGMRG
jgi:hypothetical protein